MEKICENCDWKDGDFCPHMLDCKNYSEFTPKQTEKDSKITGIEDNMPHEVAELICLNCHKRWIGAYPQITLLKNLVCKCGAKGLVIKTGQTLEAADELKEIGGEK